MAKRKLIDSVIRVLDVTLTTLLLVALTPLCIFISLAIIISMGRPVFYNQTRVGKNGKSFSLHKFRSMKVSQSQKIKQAHQEVTRVTALGKWLRKTHLDEIPQLINVLRNEMSLVGPRPHEIAQDAEFRKIIANYERRFDVHAGLTGVAQVQGFHGPLTNNSELQTRIDLDIEWVKSRSVKLYLSVLIRTIVIFVTSLIP